MQKIYFTNHLAWHRDVFCTCFGQFPGYPAWPTLAKFLKKVTVREVTGTPVWACWCGVGGGNKKYFFQNPTLGPLWPKIFDNFWWSTEVTWRTSKNTCPTI